MQNGHGKLDLTELTELAHIKVGAVEFDIPMDIPLTLQVKWRRIFKALDDKPDLSDEETARYEDQLWEVADQILATAQPPIGRSAREILNLAALLQLAAFLTQGLDSVQKSISASRSPTPITEPSL